MALPTFVATGTRTQSAGALTLPLPAGIQQDDILIAFLMTQRTQAISVSGYTQAANSPLDGPSGTGVRITVYWKRATSSESNPTTTDSGTSNWGIMVAVRGCITTGDPFHVTNNGLSASAGTSASINGATTTIPDCFVLVAAAVESGTDQTGMSSIANADLANLTSRNVAINGSPGFGGVVVVTGEKASAGAYGATTGTKQSGFGYAGWTGALMPPAVALPPVRPSIQPLLAQ